MIYSILRGLVIFAAVRSFLARNYESFALCILSLLLFLLPALFEETLKVRIPPLFEIIIYLFIYAAEILGEVNHYYTAIPGWDSMLHTLNGFLCAAIGFSLVDVLNRRSKGWNLTPIYLTIVAFCFSMTIGVIWEFIEFTLDQLFYLDMQKDFMIRTIGSVTLDPTRSQVPFRIPGIVRTLVEIADGTQYLIEGGYLDIGLIDTMKDLFVNLVGAAAFSVIGYIYEKYREAKEKREGVVGLAGKLMVQTISDEELQDVRDRVAADRIQRADSRLARRSRTKNLIREAEEDIQAAAEAGDEWPQEPV